MFVNFSNHPSDLWSEEQKVRTQNEYGDIVDVSFPAVDPKCSEEDILALAEKSAKTILALNPDAVLCQGEFGLTYAVIQRMKKNNIKTLAACSKRMVNEEMGDDGEYVKVATFKFVKYREYVC